MEIVRKYAGLACKIVQDVIDAIDRPVLPPASAAPPPPPAYNGPLPPPAPGRGVYLGGKRHRKTKKIKTQKRSRRN